MIYKKSVVLSAIDNSLKKAVVNLDSKTGTIKGEVKLYNFVEEPLGVLSLGLLIEGKVQKVGLSRVGYMCYTFGTVLNSIPENCTCALVASRGGTTEALLLGSITGSGNATMEERLIASLGVLNTKQPNQAQKILEKNNVEFDDDEDIEKEIDECLNKCNQCENCTYKTAFYNDAFTKEGPEICKENFQTSNFDNEAAYEIKNSRINDFYNLHNNPEKQTSFKNGYCQCDEEILENLVDINEKKIENGKNYNFNYKNVDFMREQPQKPLKEFQDVNFPDDNLSFDDNFQKDFQPKEENEQNKEISEEEDFLNETKKNIKNGRIRKPPLESSAYFFDEISSQLDMLFEKYPPETVLAEIIPNSKWVKVDFEEEGKYYVVGLIFVNQQVKYVCYGIPAKWSSSPPSDFNENAQWLPINVSNSHGDGYWLTYQDAIDGEMVKVDVI